MQALTKALRRVAAERKSKHAGDRVKHHPRLESQRLGPAFALEHWVLKLPVKAKVEQGHPATCDDG
jgi:hypothetical protein